MSKLLALIAAASFAAVPVHAETLTIDFNTTPGADGRLGTADDEAVQFQYPRRIEEEYAAVGVHFASASLMTADFFNGDAANTFLTSQPVSAWFDVPVYGISIDSYSYWNATLSAYDAAGNLLATDRVESNGWRNATLSVASAAPIYRFTVLPDEEGKILNLDNLALTVSPVPEPSQWGMLAGGLMLLGATLRRRR